MFSSSPPKFVGFVVIPISKPAYVSRSFRADDFGPQRGKLEKAHSPQGSSVCRLQTNKMDIGMKSNTKATTKALEPKKEEGSNYEYSRVTPLSWVECVKDGLEKGYVCPCCAGEKVERIDSFAGSRTVRCKQCDRCALILSASHFCSVIPLEDFHFKRGSDLHQRRLDDLTMAQSLVDCLTDKCWPTPATVIDYGINSPGHFKALQSAYKGGCNVYDLDRVMGDGRAITQLVHAVPGQSVIGIRFRTAYDEGLDF